MLPTGKDSLGDRRRQERQPVNSGDIGPGQTFAGGKLGRADLAVAQERPPFPRPDQKPHQRSVGYRPKCVVRRLGFERQLRPQTVIRSSQSRVAAMRPIGVMCPAIPESWKLPFVQATAKGSDGRKAYPSRLKWPTNLATKMQTWVGCCAVAA